MRARDRRRGSAAARGYDTAWRWLRAEHLAMEPDCACGCGQSATDVDHIVPRAAGGSDDHANLQSLAHGHHSRKTVLADGGFGHLPRKGLSRTAQTMASSLARTERFRDSGSMPNVTEVGAPWRCRIVGSGEEDPTRAPRQSYELAQPPSPPARGPAGLPRYRRLGRPDPRQSADRPRRRWPCPDRGGDQPRRTVSVPVLYVELEPDEERLVLATLDPIGAMAEASSERLAELLAEITVDDAGLAALLRDLAPPKTGLHRPRRRAPVSRRRRRVRQDRRAVAPRRAPAPVRRRDERGGRGAPPRWRRRRRSSSPIRRMASSLDPTWRDGVYNALGPAEAPYMRIDGRAEGEHAPRAAGGAHGRTRGHRNTTLSGDTRVDWSEAFALVPSLTVGYVWHAGVHAAEVAQGLERIGFEIVAQIIWDKGLFAIGRSWYHWAHEPAWVVRKPGVAQPVPRLPRPVDDLAGAQPEDDHGGLEGRGARPPGPEARRPVRDADRQPPAARRELLRPVRWLGHDAHRRRDPRSPRLRAWRSIRSTSSCAIERWQAFTGLAARRG